MPKRVFMRLPAAPREVSTAHTRSSMKRIASHAAAATITAQIICMPTKADSAT
ncbi:hypothetical protein [Pseudoxanthomonas suwonensis]